MMSEENTREIVRAFIEPHLQGHALDDHTDIFATGYVNSLFAMQLAMFLERRLSLRLDAPDMHLDNFRTVDGLVGLVIRKQAND